MGGRGWLAPAQTMQTQFGLGENEVEDLKEMMLDLGGSWKMWALTSVVGLLHSVFAFLAFKNDVGFWKARNSLEGLSVRTFFSSFICQSIILLKLLDSPNVSAIITTEVRASERRQEKHTCACSLSAFLRAKHGPQEST